MKIAQITLIGFLIASFGCTEKVDFPVPNDKNKRIVVDGMITNEKKAHRVQLSYTSDFNNNGKVDAVSNATVSIHDGSNTYPLLEKSPGVYETLNDVQGEIGKTYRLDITLANGSKHTAISTMKAVGNIDELTYEKEIEEDEEEYILFVDGQGRASYYMFRLTVNGIMQDQVVDYTIISNDLLQNSRLEEVEVGLLNAFDLEEGENNVTVEMFSIDENYHEFIRAFQLQAEKGEFFGGLFDGPAANIPSNVSNNGLGVFGASAVVLEQVTLINEQ